MLRVRQSPLPGTTPTAQLIPLVVLPWHPPTFRGGGTLSGGKPSLEPTQLTNLLVSRASSGKVGDAKTGSPNKLLYSLAGDDGGCGNDCPSDDTPLDNGVGISVSGVQGSSNYFYIDVPAALPT